MCQGFHNGDLDELIDMIKHEGWHAVQHRCRNGVPYLDDQKIAARLPQVMQSTTIAITQNNNG